MSRSNNTEIKNPAVRFFEYSGDAGKFKYYDKEQVNEKGEKGVTVWVDLPFRFLVIDILSTISGFSDAEQSGFWSNDVRHSQTEPFTIRTKNGIWGEGLYRNIKEKLINAGGEYAQSIYIGFFDENKTLQLGHIKLRGAANSAWIDFRKKNNVFKGAITVKSTVEGQKGKTIYQIPVFSTMEVSEATEQASIKIDHLLQEYLNIYFARKGITNVKQEEKAPNDVAPPLVNTAPAIEMPTPPIHLGDDDLPF